MFISRTELAEMIGCQPSSFACMRRWLTRNDWPFAESRSGFPQVRRDYYDARMLGRLAPKDAGQEPDKQALILRYKRNDRPQKIA